MAFIFQQMPKFVTDMAPTTTLLPSVQSVTGCRKRFVFADTAKLFKEKKERLIQ